jgi:hypothetical protein
MQYRINDKELIKWIKQIIKENNRNEHSKRNTIQADPKAENEKHVR